MAPPITFITRAHQEMRTLLFFPPRLPRPGQQRTPRVGLRTKRGGSFFSVTRPLQPCYAPGVYKPLNALKVVPAPLPAPSAKAMGMATKGEEDFSLVPQGPVFLPSVVDPSRGQEKAQMGEKGLDVGLHKNTGVTIHQRGGGGFLRNGGSPFLPLEKVRGKEQMQFVGQKRGDWFCKSVFPPSLALFSPLKNSANPLSPPNPGVETARGVQEPQRGESPRSILVSPFFSTPRGTLPGGYRGLENQKGKHQALTGYSFLSHLLLSLFSQNKSVYRFLDKNFSQHPLGKAFYLETRELQHHQSTWKDAAFICFGNSSLSQKEEKGRGFLSPPRKGGETLHQQRVIDGCASTMQPGPSGHFAPLAEGHQAQPVFERKDDWFWNKMQTRPHPVFPAHLGVPGGEQAKNARSTAETLSKRDGNRRIAPVKNHLESFLFQQGKQKCKVHYLVCPSAQQNPFFLATQIVSSLEERVPFRRLKHRLMRECIKDTRIKGVRICCSGRVATRSKKAQKARSESIQWGQTSLNVFSDFVHFANKSALTPFGKIGVKVWICYK